MRWLWVAALVWLFATTAHAAPTAGSLDVPHRHQAALELGAAPGMFLEASYGYRFVEVVRRSHIVPTASFGFPIPGVVDGRSYDVSAGANWIAPVWRGFGITGSAAFFLSSARTVSADLVGWGLQLAVLPGFYHARGFAALNVAWQPTISTHVRNRDVARDTFTGRYPDASTGPRDGWYAPGGHRVRIGVEAGGTIRGRVTLYVGGGLQLTPNGLGIFAFPDVGMLPFYVRGGAAVHF